MEVNEGDARRAYAQTLSGFASAHSLLAMGDWQGLGEVDLSGWICEGKDPRVGALVAAARLQSGALAAAKEAALASLDAGCDEEVLSRHLLAGLHFTLARVAKLLGEAGDWSAQNAAADQLLGIVPGDPLAHARQVRELARIGLMPEALAAIQAESQAINELKDINPRAAESRLEVLRSEVEILQHEHSLELQRRSRVTAATPGDDSAASRLEVLRSLSTSQLGQDLWVIEKCGMKRGGYFVEFGATDGVRLSNTYLLEMELGWTGLCAEPNPAMFEQLRRNRRCRTLPACIGARTGESVEFVLAEEFGSMVHHMNADMHAKRRAAYYDDPAMRLQLTTVSLHDFLLQNGAPHTIDYISIDTEGSELEILQSFPFEQWNVRAFTIEHNFGVQREAIRELLAAHGYAVVEAKWDDWFWRDGEAPIREAEPS